MLCPLAFKLFYRCTMFAALSDLPFPRCLASGNVKFTLLLVSFNMWLDTNHPRNILYEFARVLKNGKPRIWARIRLWPAP